MRLSNMYAPTVYNMNRNQLKSSLADIRHWLEIIYYLCKLHKNSI